MDILTGILIPFIGTTAGSACVFFLRGELKPGVQKAFLGFASGVMVAASVWCVCFSRSRNEIHDRFQCWISGWYCVGIRTGSTQLFKTQTAIQTYNSWSPFGFTWNLPAYISLHFYN